MIEISVSLHGKPEWELNFDEELTGYKFRAYGASLKERMEEVGFIVDKLKEHGFKPYGRLYDLGFSNPDDLDVKTEEEMREYLSEFIPEEHIEAIRIESVPF
jgi:hypothetical protein